MKKPVNTTKQTVIQDTEVLVVKLAWYKRLWQWWLGLWKEEYEVVVWFHTETTINAEGLTTVKRNRKEFQLKDITKKTPTHIVGKDIFGKPFEIKTVEPFDYQIRKIL